MSVASQSPEDDIVRSWSANARSWVAALRSQSIGSRVLVTNQAILDAVGSIAPRTVLDIGCGEGWLCRALLGRGVETLGVDGEPALVAEAQRLGGGRYAVRSYREIATGEPTDGPFDAAVCNFSLLGDASVESLLGSLGGRLNDPGHVIVQTLHPVVACGAEPYRDGWRPGSWAGFDAGFVDPPPWYFRTLAGWHAMLRRCGFEVVDCREPTAPGAAAPSSIIFIGRQRT